MRRWAALILGATGGLACGQLGAIWVAEALRLRADPAIALAVGIDPPRMLAAATALLLAMLAGLVGGLLARHRVVPLSGALLLVGGIGPGLVDPRAFVVTSVLCLAGIVAMGIEGRAARAPRPRRARPPVPSLVSRHSHVSVG